MARFLASWPIVTGSISNRMAIAAAIATWICVSGSAPRSAVAAVPTQEPVKSEADSNPEESKKMRIATFGGGCFWCVEASMELLKGVEKAVSGYEGGFVENPTYEQVCTKRTGHVEVVQIHYDPEVISYEELLKVFFKVHDPTTKNQQGNDIGPQYRSVIFYHDDEQKVAAKKYIEKLEESGVYGRKRVVTDVEPTKTFYEAEDYHQDYFKKNPDQAYCQYVVRPKVEKVNTEFKIMLKDK